MCAISGKGQFYTLNRAHTGCSLKIVFFPRILEFPPLPRQHSAAIGCTKNYLPKGVTVHSHCIESFEGEIAMNCGKKNIIFLNTLYLNLTNPNDLTM